MASRPDWFRCGREVVKNIENELRDAVVVPHIVAPERSSSWILCQNLLLRADSGETHLNQRSTSGFAKQIMQFFFIRDLVVFSLPGARVRVRARVELF